MTARQRPWRPAGTWNTPETRRDTVDRYTRRRQSIREIATDLNCSYSTVRSILRQESVTLRPPGGRSHAAAAGVRGDDG